MAGVLTAGRARQLGYAIIGIWQLVLALCFTLTRKWWTNGKASKKTAAPVTVRPASNRSTLRLPVVWVSIAAFFIYTGIEVAAGTWAFSLFTGSRAIAASTAGMWVSVYWGSLTAGRFFSGMIAGAVPVNRLLRFCIIGLACGATPLWLNITSLMSFLGLALMGCHHRRFFRS